MLSENPIRSALSLLLVAVLLSTVFFAPTVAQATTYPEREVKLLLVYDDTYDYAMRSNGITGSLEHRLEQMARLAEVPFKQTWNISFDVTVMSYEDAFGTEPYVNSCPYVHIQEEDAEWDLHGNCACVGNSQCVSGHHNSAHRLVDIAHNFAVTSNQYDVAAIFVGHSLCCMYNNEHIYCGGLSRSNGNGFVVKGSTYFSSSETQCFSNLLATIKVFQHEFSHNFGLHNQGSDFSNPNNCTANYPCTMNKDDFKGIVFAGNVWCPKCCARFNYSRIGSLVGGE